MVPDSEVSGEEGVLVRSRSGTGGSSLRTDVGSGDPGSTIPYGVSLFVTHHPLDLGEYGTFHLDTDFRVHDVIKVFWDSGL